MCNCIKEKEAMCKEVHGVEISITSPMLTYNGTVQTIKFADGNVNGTDKISISYCPFCGQKL